jgi:4-amino-4-deoxy-L-arabinose transferase-like glycosyltransferase
VQRTGKETGRPGADLLVAAGCGLLAFGLYARTLAPTVLYYAPENFDSAHLQVVAYTLGIPSFTGYPTYAMLAHLFTYLPVGDPAYRVNLASAVFGALAVAAAYLLGRRLGAGPVGSAAGALAFAVGATFWGQAVIAEVYTLHVLLATMFLLTLLAWRRHRRDRYLLLAAFLGGLAMTNHLTSVFLLPAALLFVAVVDRSRLARPALILKGAAAFVAGLLPYLYLPVRASMDPPLVNAGPAGNPATLPGFLDLVSGGEHKGRMFVFGPAELPERLSVYAGHLLDNLNPALLALAAFGVALWALRDRAALALLGTIFLLNLLYALEYDIEDLEIYFVPTYLVLCLALARGAGAALERLRGSRAPRWLVPAAAAVVLAAVLVGVPGAYAAADRSGDYRGREILEAVASGTEEGSTVLYHGRTLHYMQLVEGRRQDLRLEDPFYTADWVERSERALRRGAVYVLYPGATNTRLFREAGYDLVPVKEGMLYEVVRETP